MWWQDRLPALLSLSFVLGLHGVPGLIIMFMYLLCTAQPQNILLLLFTDSFYGGQPAIKLWVQHLLLYSLQRKGLLNRFGASSYSYSATNAHLGAAQYDCSLLLFATSFEAKSSLWHWQPSMGQTVLYQWGNWKPACTASSNMAAGFSLAFWLGGKKRVKWNLFGLKTYFCL